MASTPFVTLHLSDIHFGQEKGEAIEINRDARDQLIRKVREIAVARRAAGKPPVGSLIITGDIAYSGQKHQFDEAVEWLAAVSDAAGCDRLSVQVVPGNHDVDRGKSPMVSGMIDTLLRDGRPHLDVVLASDEDRSALYKRFAAYQTFANGYGCPLDTNGGNAGTKEHIFAPGLTLRIVGLNSALLCCGKETDDDPKLLLGARQRIIPEVDDVEYVVLIHHPMRWLRDGIDAQAYIDNRARVLMCGHEHKARISLREIEGNGQLLTVDAGATVPDYVSDEYTYTFNVIEMDLTSTQDAIDVCVDSYVWRQSELRFHQDTSDHEGGAPKVYRLSCPKFAAASAHMASEAPPPEPPEAAQGTGAADGAAEEPSAPVEPIEVAQQTSGGDDTHQFAQARSDFFHKLSMAQRLGVLVKLKAIPDTIETLSSNLLLRQLDRMHRQGRTAELVAAIDEARRGG